MNALTFAFLAMLCWGIAPIFSKAGLLKMDPFTALTIRSVSITVILLVVGLFTGKLAELTEVGVRPSLLILSEGVFAALLGQLAYYYAQKMGEVSLVSPMVAAFPVVTVVLAILLLGEKLTLQKVLGTALMVVGVMVLKI